MTQKPTEVKGIGVCVCVCVCRKEVVRSLAITSILRHSWNALIFAQLGTFCRTSFLAGISKFGITGTVDSVVREIS